MSLLCGSVGKDLLFDPVPVFYIYSVIVSTVWALLLRIYCFVFHKSVSQHCSLSLDICVLSKICSYLMWLTWCLYSFVEAILKFLLITCFYSFACRLPNLLNCHPHSPSCLTHHLLQQLPCPWTLTFTQHSWVLTCSREPQPWVRSYRCMPAHSSRQHS